MNTYVLNFKEIDKTKLPLVGGKGANLGELSRIKEIQVPEGFCVTTEAYQKTIGQTPELSALLEQLSRIKTVDDKEKISEISVKIRRAIEETPIPQEIAEAITRRLTKLGEKDAYAVRSSATAEDLPTASFAGQQDTYLNIIGAESILKHISQCWASLFTDRAVTYRIQNGFDHSRVQLSVVVQRMVFPEAAGILFTADPITGNRKVVSIDASFGLGEALVSGMVTADNYKVRNGRIFDKKISTKKLAVYALKDGGTQERAIKAEDQNRQTLTGGQILELEKIGRRIEAHFGRPQDIEWCLYENKFFIVQSRPITTLYPIPKVKDEKGHVYMSFGHQQMMTDAMKPLGLSVFRYSGSNETLMAEAGGRLFIDLTHDMASTFGRSLAIASIKREAERLVQCGVFREIDDMCYLSFGELREAARKQKFDYHTILRRKEAFAVYEKLSPPRLMTSEGEIVGGEYVSAKAPKGAILGVAASSGIAEGRARVILRLEDAKLSKGDILVTKFTDPSWTPVFVSISGLVAEVGGMMTHGSVVAREYGLPAVVGVENATKSIKDGQRIRINGAEGYVEILESQRNTSD